MFSKLCCVPFFLSTSLLKICLKKRPEEREERRRSEGRGRKGGERTVSGGRRGGGEGKMARRVREE